MSHVSRKQLSESAQKKIQNIFLGELVRIADKQEMGAFLGKLLTESEKIMLPKRLAAFMMIDKYIPDTHICQALNLTAETVARYRLAYQLSKNQKEPIVQIVQNVSIKKEAKQLLKEILKSYVIPAMFGRIPKRNIF